MLRNINLGDEQGTIDLLVKLRERKQEVSDVRIHNSHITELNKIIGRKVFKKESLYIGSETLWELMQPTGGKGRHNYHGLSPKNIYDALHSLRKSKKIEISYDDRYLIVTIATIFEDVNIAVLVTTKGSTKENFKNKVNRIITIYPYKKK